MASSTICLPGMFSSMPIIKPKPRTSYEDTASAIPPVDTEIAAHLLDVRQQPVQNVEEFQRHAAGQRSAAEGGPMHARPMDCAALSLATMTPSGMPQATGFAATTMSGNTTVGQLIGEVIAGAADAALGLVEDQQGIITIRQFARFAAYSLDMGRCRLRPGSSSMTIPAVRSVKACSSAARSLGGTNRTPGSSGSKSWRYFSWPVMESAPRVRP